VSLNSNMLMLNVPVASRKSRTGKFAATWSHARNQSTLMLSLTGSSSTQGLQGSDPIASLGSLGSVKVTLFQFHA